MSEPENITKEEQRIQKLMKNQKNQKNHKEISQMYVKLYSMYQQKVKEEEEQIKKQQKLQQKNNPAQPQKGLKNDPSQANLLEAQKPKKTKKLTKSSKIFQPTQESTINQFSDIDLIAENFESFDLLDKKLKKDLLSFILVPKLRVILADIGIPSLYENDIKDLLLDFNVFDTNDIIGVIQDQLELEERVEEAHQIILSGGKCF